MMGKRIFLLAAFQLNSALIGCLCLGQNVPTYVSKKGLVGWWDFNGNAQDASGNSNHGSVKGAVLTSDRYGSNNSAFFFDGIDDWIEVPNSASVTLTGDMTMSIWVKTFGPNGKNYQALISKRQTYWTWEYSMALSYHSGNPHNAKMIASRALGMGNQQQAWSSGTYSNNNWELWTVVFSSGSATIYKNGVRDSIWPLTLKPDIQNCPLLFGRHTLADNSEPFFGNLDDIGIWNRALSQQEITQLYNAGSPAISGLVWTKLSAGNCLRVTPNIDSTMLFLARATDVLKSSDRGANWTSTNWTFPIIRDGYALSKGGAFSSFNGGMLALSRFDNGWAQSTDNGNNYTASGPQGFGTGCVSMLSLDDGRFLAGRGGFLRGIYKSSGSDNTTWVNKYPGFDPYDFTHLNQDVIFSCGNYFGGILLKSINRGDTWTTSTFPKYISDVEVVGDSLYFINSTGEVRVSSAENIASSVLRYNFNFNKEAFNFATYSKKHSLFVMSSSNQGIYLSNDKCASWVKYSIPGVADYRDATIVGDRIYIATDAGLYVAELQASFGNCLVPDFNPLPDTLRVCGASTILNAGTGFQSYSWSNGAAVSSITVSSSGSYKVTSTNSSGCRGVDSTFVSLVKASIIQNDTTVCKGASIRLSLDSLFPGSLSSNANLPPNLNRGLVAYYPFNGNANDEISNGNNGAVFNASLAPDRNSSPNSAYQFNSASKSRIVVPTLDKSMRNSFSYSFWVKPEKTYVIPPQGQGPNAASGLFDNPCVIHPIHGWNYGDEQKSAGTGVYVGTNGLYLEEHSAGWEAVPISHSADLNGWHLINIIYENKVPFLYIDGVFIKKGLPSVRDIYASLGPDKYPIYNYSQSGIGTGYRPTVGAAQYFQGSIDDIAYYGRALQPSEINQIYYKRPTITWSTGDSTVDIRVSPIKSTTYYVTVTDGFTSCTDSIRVNVSDLPNFNPLPDTSRVCGTTAKLDAGTGFSSYSWSSGAATQTIDASSPGWYKVTVSNGAGCTAFDSTYLGISFVNILNRDTTICKGSSLMLNVDSSFMGYAACNGNQLPANLKNGLVVFYPFCGNANDASGNGRNAQIYGPTLTSDRFGNPNAAYLFSGNSQYMRASVPNLPSAERTVSLWMNMGTDVGSPTIMGYGGSGSCGTSWIMGLNHRGEKNYVATSHCAVREISYKYTASQNNRWIHFLVTTSANGSKIFIDGVEVASSSVSFNNTNVSAGLLFIGAFVNFSGQGPHIDGNSGWWNGKLDDIYIWNRVLDPSEIKQLYDIPSQLLWSNGSIGNSSFVRPLQNTTFYASLSNGFAKCTDSVTIRVTSVDTSISPQGPTSICSNGGALPIQAGSAASYQWLRNGLAIAGASSRIYQASQNGDYRVALTSAEGCRDTSRAVQINLNPDLIVSFAVDDSVKCIPDRRFTFVNQTTIGTGSMTYTWDFGDGTTSQSPSPSVQYRMAGTYRVTLRASSDLGCVRSASRTLRVDSMPKAMRYDPVNALANRPFTLDARNIGTSWQWTPPNQLTGADTRRPIFQGDRDQQYLITIRSASGCATVDTLFVRAVKDYGIHVPGGFTPDNDGRNDRLHPIVVGIREMRIFKVFNRWGEMVYDNRNATASTGWDGLYKGKPAPMETYVWIAEGIDLDGKVIRRSGNTILIR